MTKGEGETVTRSEPGPSEQVDGRQRRTTCPVCNQEDVQLVHGPQGTRHVVMAQHTRQVVTHTIGPFAVDSRPVACKGSGEAVPHFVVECEDCGFEEDAYGPEDAEDMADYHADMTDCPETPVRRPVQ